MTRPCPVDPERFEHVLQPSKITGNLVWKVTLQRKNS